MVCRVPSIVTIYCVASHDLLPIVISMFVCVCKCMSCWCSLSWYHWKCIGFPVARWSHFASNGRTSKKQRPKKLRGCYAMPWNIWKWKWVVRRLCGSVSDTCVTTALWYSLHHSQHFYRFLRHFVRSVQCVRHSNGPKDMKICALFFFNCETNRVSTWDIYSLYHFPVSHKYIYIYHHVIQVARISIKYLSKWEQKAKAIGVIYSLWFFSTATELWK